jgi:hypothetical protein
MGLCVYDIIVKSIGITIDVTVSYNNKIFFLNWQSYALNQKKPSDVKSQVQEETFFIGNKEKDNYNTTGLARKKYMYTDKANG